MKIRRLLVANRGEIALRVFRTAERMGIETVAVYSEADAGALHVRSATIAHPLGGNASADSYLRIDKILAAARATGADAVHPGYGFLSENAEFAQAVGDAGLLWVGPPASAIRSLGSKARARQLALDRGIPCLPGYQGEDQSDAQFAREARRIGFPLMVKAAAGGGGRGMRLVSEASQLLPALQSARSEAESAFGSGELLLERALPRPRHVEVQVFVDTHGNGLHLGERDCSVQRRHQKLIEETPSPAVDAALRERMGACALELAQAAGYVGAGTVEFLLDAGSSPGQAPEFFLMEMNTRLQVEHAVTEAVTGLDLVEWQLRVARGERLPCPQADVCLDGHAIEVRLCAEDEGFRPHGGRVRRFRPPAGPQVRFDHGVFEGLEVPSWYDSMLGKLIVRGRSRGEAIERLAEALDRLQVLGLPTNRRLLAACLRHPVFARGEATTAFLQEHGEALRAALAEEEWTVAAEAALSAVLPRGAAPVLASPFDRPLRVRVRGRALDVPVCEAEGVATAQAEVVAAPGRGWHVQVGRVDLFVEDASFDPAAGSNGSAGGNALRAPFNGKVIAVRARAGAAVKKGDTVLVVESMKLEHALAAPRDGTLRAVNVEAGQQVATGQVLLAFEAE